MSTGRILSMEEFEVNDGPGIRKAVFLKGCPLRCVWCHNPEGISRRAQLMVNRAACTGCGRCTAVCAQPGGCIACGACVAACPGRFRRLCGEEWEAAVLAALLRREEAFFRRYGGGVTITGGEPLMQPEFLMELLEALAPVHRVVETCGFASEAVFEAMARRCELILFDIKHMDGAKHALYTGQDNGPILANLRRLFSLPVPFVARVPLIPGVNDTDENFREMARLLSEAPNLQRVELLPYHKTAGAKYAMLGEAYHPSFSEEMEPRRPTRILEQYKLKWVVL